MDSTTFIAEAAIVVSVLSAGFTGWQAVISHRKQSVEKRSKHAERLIEESVANWEYYPKTSGESLQGKMKEGIPVQRHELQYLTQAKGHLKKYDFWKLYEEGPILSKTSDEHADALSNEITSELENAVKAGLVRMPASGPWSKEFTVMSVFNNLFYGLQPNALVHEYRALLIASVSEAQIDGTRFDGSHDDAKKLADFLNSIVRSGGVFQAARAYVDARKALDDNAKSFAEELRKVVESVRVSNYTNLKGKCEIGY